MTKEIKGAQYINDGTDEQMVSRVLALSSILQFSFMSVFFEGNFWF
jgi:hypothetical protein